MAKKLSKKSVSSAAEARLHVQHSVKNFPEKPGVYIMKSESRSILYIGKAKNLKLRVQSYMRPAQDRKTSILMSKVYDIEYLITCNEFEALLLENNLIKQHQPHYNIDLKDGKTFPVIRVTAEEYPRVFKTRHITQDGSKYYGPFPAGSILRSYLTLIEKLYPLRRCRKKTLQKRSAPCLYYHLQLCAAPCAGKISKEDYLERIRQITGLLEGNTAALSKTLQRKMEEAAKALQFEEAREYRDAIQSIIKLNSEQKIVDFKDTSRDYVACASESDSCSFVIFRMQEGKLMYSHAVTTSRVSEAEDHYTEFLMRYYQDAQHLPKKLYLQYDAIDAQTLHKFFRHELGNSPSIYHVRTIHDARIMNMAIDNAWMELRKRSDTTVQIEVLKELQNLLNLPTLPRHIEGFDIAHIGGKHTVAAMVCFTNGRPDSPQYRKYHIKSIQPGTVDDFESMREVIARRYMRIKNDAASTPDLILIDGGKGQVSAAQEILAALDLATIPVIGLAKQQENIYSPTAAEPLLLPAGHSVLRLLQHVRDEAHRFATTFRKKLQEHDLGARMLTDIPGIGPKRAKKILERFESVGNVLAVPPMVLSKTVSISLQQAQYVQETLRETKSVIAGPE